jgi:hypothetical protein
MLRRFYVLTSIAFALSTLAATDAAAAQRTFVSSKGSPANTAFNCSITKPCRMFSDAISVTDDKGEVIVLDSAGYGTVTITQSVSIIAPAGVYAGITVFSGDYGVIVNGSNINVVLRGLTINGQGGISGIGALLGASLTIEDCEIANMFADGIVVTSNSTVTVKNTVTRDNGVGIAAIEGSRVTVANSVLANNANVGLLVGATPGTVTDVMVTRSTITGSPIGLQADAYAGGTARLVSDGNVINNTTTAAFTFTGPGTKVIYTSGTNTVGFNNAIVTGDVLTSIGTH